METRFQHPDYASCCDLFSPIVVTCCSCTHQRVSLHVLPPGELLATDFTGVGPLTGVGAHVPLQDALVHSRETAVGALELFTDHCEVIHCRDRSRGEGGRGKKKKKISLE